MSKEMGIIVLGLAIIAIRTLSGLPGEWQTMLLVVCGGAVAVLGFLLRGEALSRGTFSNRNFVDNTNAAEKRESSSESFS